jgi:hypothetical protein
LVVGEALEEAAGDWAKELADDIRKTPKTKTN